MGRKEKLVINTSDLDRVEKITEHMLDLENMKNILTVTNFFAEN